MVIHHIAAGALKLLLQAARKAGISLICFHKQIDIHLLYIVKIRFYRLLVTLILNVSGDLQGIIRQLFSL